MSFTKIALLHKDGDKLVVVRRVDAVHEVEDVWAPESGDLEDWIYDIGPRGLEIQDENENLVAFYPAGEFVRVYAKRGGATQ